MHRTLVLWVACSAGVVIAASSCGDGAETAAVAGTTSVTSAGPGGGGGEGGGGTGGEGVGGGGEVTATLPSKGGSIAVDEGGITVAVANKASDSVSLFIRGTLSQRASVPVGDEPVSVVFSPNGKRLYVVNRADQTVSVIDDADTEAAEVTATIDVGSEPGQAALSPSGATLYVSNWNDGTVSVIDTASAEVTQTVNLGGAPYAVCVTNDQDDDDSDETIYVTDFYSQPKPGVKESVDGSRTGRVFALEASSLQATGISLEPITVTGVLPNIDAAGTKAFANQLYSCAVNGEQVFVTAVGASPAAFELATDFHQNVHGLVYAIDIASNTVNDGRTVNLSQLVTSLTGERRFVAIPHDIAFVNGSGFGYIASLSSNSVQRVDFAANPPIAGAPSVNFMPTGFSPTGIAVYQAEAFVYNEVGRSVSRLDLATQSTTDQDIVSASLPAAESAEADILTGQRFFNTGQTRWSTGAWCACTACHPFGTTDNVSWVFPAGPRQTVDTSATYDKAGTKQRILNWSAIFDEVHDFELNTRTVAGGVGAIVSSTELNVASRIDFVGPGGIPNPTNGFNVGSVKGVNDELGALDDWDLIDDYVKSIRSPRARKNLGGDPERGRELFEEANCHFCHGGPLWTLSERYYTPIKDGDLRDLTFGAAGVTGFGQVRADQVSVASAQLGATAIILNDANGAPQRHLCTVRIVGTFDADGPDGRGADEVRQTNTPAQGVGGFNVPSLLNMTTGGPYLHNGAAETLEDLLDPNGDFTTHLRAGSQIFTPTADDVEDLIAFLQTIDDDTPVIAIPAGQRFCPNNPIPPGG